MFGSVCPRRMGSSISFSLARTSLCFKEVLFLNAITGGGVQGKYGLMFHYFPVLFYYLFESLGIITKLCDKD